MLHVKRMRMWLLQWRDDVHCVMVDDDLTQVQSCQKLCTTGHVVLRYIISKLFCGVSSAKLLYVYMSGQIAGVNGWLIRHTSCNWSMAIVSLTMLGRDWSSWTARNANPLATRPGDTVRYKIRTQTVRQTDANCNIDYRWLTYQPKPKLWHPLLSLRVLQLPQSTWFIMCLTFAVWHESHRVTSSLILKVLTLSMRWQALVATQMRRRWPSVRHPTLLLFAV